MGGIWQNTAPAIAANNNQCVAVAKGPQINNQAIVNYSDSNNSPISAIMNGLSNQNIANSYITGSISLAAQGVRDKNGTLVLGTVTGAVTDQLMQLGFTRAQATKGILAVDKALQAMPANSGVSTIATAAKNAFLQAVPEQAALIQGLGNLDDQKKTQLQLAISVGLTTTQADLATNTAWAMMISAPNYTNIDQASQVAFQSLIGTAPTPTSLQNIQALSQNIQSSIAQGDVVYFQFLLTNPGNTSAKVQFNDGNTTSEKILPSGGQAQVTVKVLIGQVAANGTSVTVGVNSSNSSLQTNLSGFGSIIGLTYEDIQTASSNASTQDCSVTQTLTSVSNSSQTVVMLPPVTSSTPLTDPLGKVTGCAGETLGDYNGFTIGLYEPDPNDSTGGVTGLVALTNTQLPVLPGVNIPQGVDPNRENSNPFYLTNGNQGKYNFLLDPKRGELDRGKTYILLVNTPKNSIYSQRRIRVVIGDRTGNMVSYTATSLDGKPISSTSALDSYTGMVTINDAERVVLVFALFNLQVNTCDAQEVQITKTGDRASAAPGDTVIYRLSIKDLSAVNLDHIVVTDILPLGFQLRPNSIRAQVGSTPITVTTNTNNSTVQFNLAGNMPSGAIINLIYAAFLTPDAMRGTGKNYAIVNAQRADNHQAVKDGPAIYQLRIQPGITTDSSTIIGRVFVDKNFDGEQQPGEPGVPNAVILMDDGTQITTDENGMFSLKNVLPGYRTAVLDLTSIPGYTLAPNQFFKERNSQSRLVHLAPGGLVRINFAVTPAAREGKKP